MDRSDRRRFRRLLSAWLPVLLLELVIYLISSRPNGGWHMPIAHLDKAVHFVEYGALGGLTYRALRVSGLRGRPAARAALLAFSAIAILGAADEIHQRGILGREASRADWLADLVGSLAGIGAVGAMERRPDRYGRWFDRAGEEGER